MCVMCYKALLLKYIGASHCYTHQRFENHTELTQKLTRQFT